MSKVEVLFTPAEFQTLAKRDLSKTTAVVFDVLRATSTMVTALGNGAKAMIPVEEIEDALRLQAARPDILLAGERGGWRIRPNGPNAVAFDFGNSPREFTKEAVAGQTIAITTTNGTRALLAGRAAATVLIGSFRNFSATRDRLASLAPPEVLLICGGTYNEAAYEDVLCAGAMIDALSFDDLADSALLARNAYRLEKDDVVAALAGSRNGRRLLEQPDLRDDVAFCARLDAVALVAGLEKDGTVKAID